MIEHEHSLAMRFGMCCVYLVLAWRGHTTFKILVKFRSFVIAGVLITFAMFIGVAIGMWQAGGAEKANELIAPWGVLAGLVTAVLILPYTVLMIFSIMGIIIQGLWKLITMPPIKKKGIPQFVGDHTRLSLYEADTDLFTDAQRDSDTHLLLTGHNQPSVF